MVLILLILVGNRYAPKLLPGALHQLYNVQKSAFGLPLTAIVHGHGGNISVKLVLPSFIPFSKRFTLLHYFLDLLF